MPKTFRIDELINGCRMCARPVKIESQIFGKMLVACTPVGLVSFVYQAKKIAKKSGLLDLFAPGNVIMAETVAKKICILV